MTDEIGPSYENVNRKRRMTDEYEPSNKNWALYLSNACSEEVVKCLVYGADESTLVTTLKAVEANIALIPNNQLLSHSFLYAIVCLLERYKLKGEAQLLMHSMKVLQIICQCYRELRGKLVQMGIMNILSDIMTKEAEKQMSSHVWNESDESVTLLHIISAFLPTIDDQIYHDITNNSNEFLAKGPRKTQITREENVKLLKIVVPNLFKICQTPHCPTSHKILLLKAIYFTEDILSDLLKVEDLIRYTKNLIDTNPYQVDNIVIGFAIISAMYRYNFRQLINERMNDFLKVKKTIVSPWYGIRRFKIVFDIYHRMTTYWLEEGTISDFQMDEKDLNSRIDTINFIFSSIMPHIDNEIISMRSTSINYSNLRQWVHDNLKLTKLLSRHKGKLTAAPEGITKFQDLVTFIVKTVDALIVHNDFIFFTSDLCDIVSLPVPERPTDIVLEMFESCSFHRVLGSSQSPEVLRTDPLVRALRLLSILYEVNENWGILFGSISTERLIDRSSFISEIFNLFIERIQENSLFKLIPIYLHDYAMKYPFLMSMAHREYLFKSRKTDFYYPSFESVEIEVPRKNLFDSLPKFYELAVNHIKTDWAFKFIDEVGTGVGTNKEFYTEFFHECQRFTHGLWSGEAGEVIDGVSYVKSQSGLFPLPTTSKDSISKAFCPLGVIMAKALIDGHDLDINFSQAFYKGLFFKGNLAAQQLSLIDIKDVMPSIFKFVECLVDALKEKMCTSEEEAISNITCDGCSFEDLGVNFTLPGFPDIEMMKDGRETFLNIENIETYLKLLIWWLLYETPQKCIKQVRNGFERILDPNCLMQYFYPHEYEKLFCGLANELWTVDILKQNCVLEGFSDDAPVIQYLFEVLTSLSACDQRHFLQFVTATPRLPVWGLAVLNPKLTIKLKGADGDPDIYLPTSLTCFNTLLITAYSCKETLEEKLLLAIRDGRNNFSFS